MENYASIDDQITTTAATAAGGGPNNQQQLPISLGRLITHQQHQYPAHHPTQLSDQLLALIGRPEAVILLLDSNCNSSDIPTTQPQLGVEPFVPIAENEHRHSTTNELESPGGQNEQPEGVEIAVSIGDENQSIDPRLPEFESPVGQNEQPEGVEIAASIGAENQPRLPELHGCSDPKDVSYLLRVYPIFLGIVTGKSLWEKHTPFSITNPFMVISIVVYAMTYVNLLILSCIYDGLLLTFPPLHYKIAKYVFYILCFLGPLLLLPLLFIPRN